MKRYEWCPGNGTRYELLYGLVGGNTYITWMRFGGGSGVTSIVPDFLHYTYLMEKMDISISDAVAILEFLNFNENKVGFPHDRENYERYIRSPKLKEMTTNGMISII